MCLNLTPEGSVGFEAHGSWLLTSGCWPPIFVPLTFIVSERNSLRSLFSERPAAVIETRKVLSCRKRWRAYWSHLQWVAEAQQWEENAVEALRPLPWVLPLEPHAAAALSVLLVKVDGDVCSRRRSGVKKGAAKCRNRKYAPIIAVFYRIKCKI